MDPYIFEYKSITVSWFLFLAFISGLGAVYLSKFQVEDLLTEEAREDLNFKLILGGIVGARLYYVLLHWENYQDNLLSIFQMSHLTLNFTGTLLVGGLILWWTARRQQVSFIELSSRYTVIITGVLVVGSWIAYFDGYASVFESLLTSLWWAIVLTVEMLIQDYVDKSVYLIVCFLISYILVGIIV